MDKRTKWQVPMTQNLDNSSTSPDRATHAFEVFFDGGCPLCRREIAWLARLDRAGRLRFTDIGEAAFHPESLGLDRARLMGRIHGRDQEGKIVEGVEVFRRLYGAVGFRRLVTVSRLPGVSHALDVFYDWFAKNRLRLTGRCDSEACAVN